MQRLTVGLAVLLTFVGVALISIAVPAGAAANSWGCTAVNGFSTPSGGGFWLMRVNGSVSAYGDADWYGDASGIRLNDPIVGGAITPSGKGYWLVAQDGGIFSYGDAKFDGSMGNKRLNLPVFAMAATKSGHGYWLVAVMAGSSASATRTSAARPAASFCVSRLPASRRPRRATVIDSSRGMVVSSTLVTRCSTAAFPDGTSS